MRARLGRLGAAGVVVLPATGVALLARPSVSWSVTPIVAVPTSAHGWTPVPVSPHAARADLDGRLSRRRARQVRLVAIQATGADLEGVQGERRARRQLRQRA